jgi:hypothetical protein
MTAKQHAAICYMLKLDPAIHFLDESDLAELVNQRSVIGSLEVVKAIPALNTTKGKRRLEIFYAWLSYHPKKWWDELQNSIVDRFLRRHDKSLVDDGLFAILDLITDQPTDAEKLIESDQVPNLTDKFSFGLRTAIYLCIERRRDICSIEYALVNAIKSGKIKKGSLSFDLVTQMVHGEILSARTLRTLINYDVYTPEDLLCIQHLHGVKKWDLSRALP